MRKLLRDERGALNIAGLMLLGIAMIFLAVGFIIYPIILDATDGIMDWEYVGVGGNLTIADFTGLEQVTGIVPLLTLLGFVTAGAITGFMGVKIVRGEGSGSVSIGGTMMLGIGLIFIAVGLIIYPVVMDGVATALDNASVDNYTGLSPILSVTPLIVLVAFVTAGIVAGFFGIKTMGKSARAD